MSTNNVMEELSVKELMAKYNLIVPEIQREYVWGNNEFDILDVFIQDIKDGYAEYLHKKDNPSKELQNLISLLEHSPESSKDALQKAIDCMLYSQNINIGFLYSYRPDYYVFNDRNEDVYLIDGQQRFTTLFLILFYFANKEKNRLDEFKSIFRFDEKLEQVSFDYRVRTLTHNFIIDLISNTKGIDDLLNTTRKNWFLSNYNHDVTVKSIVGSIGEKAVNGAFPIIHKHFFNDTNSYFDYVLNNIKFWHFKTEETSQGEELYITMNSRGQQLADNENIRAKLFESQEAMENPLYWSEQWEKWQDFFWKKRNKDDHQSTADNGLNEFLRWIQIIKMTESQVIDVQNDDENTLDKKAITQMIKWSEGQKLNIEYLKLSEIQSYFESMYYLFVEFNNYQELLSDNFTGYKKFNLIEPKWLTQTNSQIDCFRLLPVLYYLRRTITKDSPKPNVNPITTFRIIRFFYNLRQDETVFKTAATQCVNGLKLIQKLSIGGEISEVLDFSDISKSILNTEEKFKLNKLKDLNSLVFEAFFWRSEDLKINKGKITHLIELAESICIDTNQQLNVDIYESLYHLYKEQTNNYERILGDLLPTDVFYAYDNGVLKNGDWHKSKDFLTFIRKIFEIPNSDISQYLVVIRKDFIKQNYTTIEDLRSESSIKRQLYIYYILHSNILGNKWDWKNQKFNFGAYSYVKNGERSIFENLKIFQLYDRQWRYNKGYNPNHGLWIQNNFEEDRDYFTELINWAHK